MVKSLQLRTKAVFVVETEVYVFVGMGMFWYNYLFRVAPAVNKKAPANARAFFKM